jgi:hypothetical protein
MKLIIKFKHILFYVFLCAAANAQAQTAITLKDGKTIDLSQTQFAIRPIQCLDDLCLRKPIHKPKNICMYAICRPLEARDIPKVLGEDVLHWRVSRSKGTMAQFIGNIPLGNTVKSSAPPVLATLDDVKALPVIGLKSINGQTSQYWVWIK